MRNKKGDLAVYAVLAAVIIIAVGVFLLVDVEPTITGFSVAGGPAGASITSCGNVNESSVLTQNISFSGWPMFPSFPCLLKRHI